jgi:DNA-binding transcriptional LysR family regulator
MPTSACPTRWWKSWWLIRSISFSRTSRRRESTYRSRRSPRRHYARAELRLRDCLAYPLALADTTLAGRTLIEQVLANASFDLEPRLVSNSVEAMKAFAQLSRGVCFQFRQPGKAAIPPGDMIALPLIDPPLLQAKLFLATRRGRVLPIAAATFVEQLKDTLAA